MGQLEQQIRNNAVLHAIPPEELRRLLPQMEQVEFATRQVIYQAGEAINAVYFPTSALMSLQLSTADGETVELATVGREGFTGLSAILNGAKAKKHGALAKVVTIIPGTAIQMKSDAFESAVDRSLALARCLRRYLNHLFTDLALSVSCNRLHSLEQRCARWLLNAMDKSGQSEVFVTQEMLAGILGVYRQSVVQVLNDLESKGVIHCERGAITVENAQPLAAMVCECYFLLKKRSEH